MTLPSRENEKRILPRYLLADDELARRISSLLISSAANEFLSHPEFQIDESIDALTFGQVLEEIESAVDRGVNQSNP
ncbi:MULTISPECIES: hypothetical protein [Mesorhizobium]|uniref:Uncharacterized protein n=1 Tax=Mesorhizobium neociceri TaxID=1307853 RepID=A0A838BCS5_9HYPH|nr:MULTISPECIES: hypothetical protein [Mesorhizobium]MBA1143867.1 hypothetical protein [Mesorhizobium neociceri]